MLKHELSMVNVYINIVFLIYMNWISICIFSIINHLDLFMKQLYLFFGLFLLPVILYSQAVQVVNKATGYPIAEVEVTIEGYKDTLYTDFEGLFSTESFTDDVLVKFSHPVFKEHKRTLREMRRAGYKVYMQPTMVLQSELSVSLLNIKEYAFDLPFYIKIIDFEEFHELGLQQLNDNLKSEDMMLMQKRMEGAGGEFLRGFASRRIVTAIDGIRLSSALNKNGIAPVSFPFHALRLERTQFIEGTGSSLYSNDQTGGVVHYLVNNPRFLDETEQRIRLKSGLQYSTHSNRTIGEFDINLSFNKLASFTSVNYIYTDNIFSGQNHRLYNDKNFGLRNEYAIRKYGKDTILNNPDPYEQLGTAYKQYSIIQKFNFKIKDDWEFFINGYMTSTSDIPIYGGVVEYNRGAPRFVDCVFLPQDKYLLSSGIVSTTHSRFFDHAELKFAYQKLNEDRMTRKYKNPFALYQYEELQIYNINLDLVKLYDVNRLVYGIEYKHNLLGSEAYLFNIDENKISEGLTRYPTNGSSSNEYTAYTNFKWMLHQRIVANMGLRYSFLNQKSDFKTESPQFQLPFEQYNKTHHIPSGSINFNIYPFKGGTFNLTYSYGKHIPILDEYGKVMTKEDKITIPSNNVQPEILNCIDFSWEQYLGNWLNLSIGIFQNNINNAVVKGASQYLGNDSLYIGIDRYLVVSNINISKARIRGMSVRLNMDYYLTKNKKYGIIMQNSFNISQGIDLENDCMLPGIAPYNGKSTITLKLSSVRSAFTVLYSGQRKREDLSIYEQDNIGKASEEGFVAWQIFNLNVSATFSKIYTLSVSANNVFDLLYRPYSSAINGQGRHFTFSLFINI